MSRLPLIGADPEFFVHQGDQLVSGHHFKCGTKEAPMRTEHGFVQVDGIALEANVPPAETKDQFVAGVLGVMTDLDKIVSKKGCKIIAQPVAAFSEAWLKKLPPQVRAIGCNPDFNAYEYMQNETPSGKSLFRTGAGHIHIGWCEGADVADFDHFSACCDLARQLDYFVGLRTLKFDPDDRRRSLYGQAGAFRPKSYGMEYRVPSNVWCKDPALIGEVYDATVAAFNFANSGGDLDKEHEQFARTCINKNITGWDELNPVVAKEIGYASSAS